MYPTLVRARGLVSSIPSAACPTVVSSFLIAFAFCGRFGPFGCLWVYRVQYGRSWLSQSVFLALAQGAMGDAGSSSL